jgi:hypothetical protein
MRVYGEIDRMAAIRPSLTCTWLSGRTIQLRPASVQWRSFQYRCHVTNRLDNSPNHGRAQRLSASKAAPMPIREVTSEAREVALRSPSNRSRNQSDASRIRSDLSRKHSDGSRISPDLSRMVSDASRIRSDSSRKQSDVSRISADLSRKHSDASRTSADLSRSGSAAPVSRFTSRSTPTRSAPGSRAS